MKNIINVIINDFNEKKLPKFNLRNKSVNWIKGKANIIIGMRRAGKTWFCFQLIDQLIKNKIKKEQILFINFEDDRLSEFNINNFQDILDVYYRKYPENKDKYCYFFFDEIHKIDGWEQFIRRILDNEKIYICITGSSAKLLSIEIATSLRGRSLTTEIFPYNFKEILEINNLKNINIENLTSKKTAQISKIYDEYNIIGGFPEVQNLNQDIREQIIRNYIDIVILRDVIERYQIKNSLVVRKLVQHFIHNGATEFSVNKFYNNLKSQQISCTKNDIYNFVDYLIDSFLIYQIPIFSRSIQKQQINPKKTYVIDHAILQNMSLNLTKDKGAILENIVFMHLRQKYNNIFYYLTKKKYEIDFIISNISENIIYQICYDISDLQTKYREIRAVNQAKSELNIDKAYIITSDHEEKIEDNIDIIPIWKFLLL